MGEQRQKTLKEMIMDEHTSSSEGRAELLTTTLKEIESKLSVLRKTDSLAYLALVKEITALLKEGNEIE